MGYELVQRWVKQTDIYRQSVHCQQDTLEVGFLVRQQFSQCFLTTFAVLSQNHFTHSYDLLVVKEHVLGTCQTDTLGSKGTCHLCIVRSISVRANLQMGIFVAQIHQCLEVTAQLGSLGRNLTGINLTGRAVQRDIVTLLISNALDGNGLSLVVNLDSTCTRYAALTHTASHNGCV